MHDHSSGPGALKGQTDSSMIVMIGRSWRAMWSAAGPPGGGAPNGTIPQVLTHAAYLQRLPPLRPREDRPGARDRGSIRHVAARFDMSTGDAPAPQSRQPPRWEGPQRLGQSPERAMCWSKWGRRSKRLSIFWIPYCAGGGRCDQGRTLFLRLVCKGFAGGRVPELLTNGPRPLPEKPEPTVGLSKRLPPVGLRSNPSARIKRDHCLRSACLYTNGEVWNGLSRGKPYRIWSSRSDLNGRRGSAPWSASQLS